MGGRFTGNTTRASRRIKAARHAVYSALLDPAAVAAWMAPEGMNGRVHDFDPTEGGYLRISLADSASAPRLHGRFTELVPDEKVVEVVEFETREPSLRGEMTVTIALEDVPGGTEVVALHEHLPPGIPPAVNLAGWEMSLGKLAALVEKNS